MSAKIDITGKRFGRLVVLEPTHRRYKGNVVWKCKCDCGNIHFVTGTNLKFGSVKSCGCLHKINHLKAIAKRSITITGKRFGRLVAIVPTPKRVGHSIVWKCQCDCGNIHFAGRSSLGIFHIKSCGCIAKEQRDITDQRFGRLIALEPTNKRVKYNVVWKCLCDCGNIHFAQTTNLNRGYTKSCGCLNDAVLWSRHTNINPMDVPFEITNCMKVRREIKKLTKELRA